MVPQMTDKVTLDQFQYLCSNYSIRLAKNLDVHIIHTRSRRSAPLVQYKVEHYLTAFKVVSFNDKCDVIKQNESELANIDVQILQILLFYFLCIVLF